MSAYTEDQPKRLETAKPYAGLDRDEAAYYVDVARQLRAAAVADLARKAFAAVARFFNFGPTSRRASPRAV